METYNLETSRSDALKITRLPLSRSPFWGGPSTRAQHHISNPSSAWCCRGHIAYNWAITSASPFREWIFWGPSAVRAHGGRSDWKKNHIYPLKKKLRGITSATLLRFSYFGENKISSYFERKWCNSSPRIFFLNLGIVQYQRHWSKRGAVVVWWAAANFDLARISNLSHTLIKRGFCCPRDADETSRILPRCAFMLNVFVTLENIR